MRFNNTKYKKFFSKQLKTGKNSHSFFGYSLCWDDAKQFQDLSSDRLIIPEEEYKWHWFMRGNIIYFPNSPSNMKLYYVESSIDYIDIREITGSLADSEKYTIIYNPILDETKSGLYKSLTDDEPIVEGNISIAPISDYLISSVIDDAARFVKNII